MITTCKLCGKPAGIEIQDDGLFAGSYCQSCVDSTVQRMRARNAYSPEKPGIGPTFNALEIACALTSGGTVQIRGPVNLQINRVVTTRRGA